MSTLICNAAEGLLQIVLMRDNVVLCAQEWPAPTRSTEILAPALAHMLQELGMKPQDISRIACVHGPGSFTGIRLVLSTAAALRRAFGARVAPVDYMEALALSAYLRLQDLPRPASFVPSVQDNLPAHDVQAERTLDGGQAEQTLDGGQAAHVLWVLTHARRNLVHCQPFSLPSVHSLVPPRLQALAAVDLCSLEVCAQRVNTVSNAHAGGNPKSVNTVSNAHAGANPKSVSTTGNLPAGDNPKSVSTTGNSPMCVGSGLLRNQAFFDQHCPQAHFYGPSYAAASFSGLVHLAQHAHYGHDDLSPLYIRPCDAVENLPAMAHKLGQDAATAEQRLNTLLERPTNPDQTYRPA